MKKTMMLLLIGLGEMPYQVKIVAQIVIIPAEHIGFWHMI